MIMQKSNWLAFALLAGWFVGEAQAEQVDLRGYGTVQSTSMPERSEFVCASVDQADIPQK